VAVRWTIAGFLALLLAYVGSKFVLEVILKR
ncbi:MAG TPA: inner membrane protein YpjD, partial [Burkholderiales bacterium]|nr:inner membrane protein YpjD [Burkholderiales bacterium]